MEPNKPTNPDIDALIKTLSTVQKERDQLTQVIELLAVAGHVDRRRIAQAKAIINDL